MKWGTSLFLPAGGADKEVHMSMNILVVDDEKEIADVIELYLQNDQYNVYKFYTARLYPQHED